MPHVRWEPRWELQLEVLARTLLSQLQPTAIVVNVGHHLSPGQPLLKCAEPAPCSIAALLVFVEVRPRVESRCSRAETEHRGSLLGSLSPAHLDWSGT